MEKGKTNNLFISVDAGKFLGKAEASVGATYPISKENKTRTSIRSKWTELDKEEFVEIDPTRSAIVELDGKRFIIGEEGENISQESSKKTDLHKLITYTLITRYLRQDTKTNVVYMVLSCPFATIKNKEAKEAFKAYIQSDGPITIKVNSKKYHFTIGGIFIKQEGSGYLLLEKKNLANEKVAFVDLGGLNVFLEIIDDQIVDKPSQTFDELGTYNFYKYVKDELEALDGTGNIIKNTEIEKILKRGYRMPGNKKREAKAIDIAKNKYILSILEFIKNSKVDLMTCDKIIFVGGTTVHVKENLEKIISERFKDIKIEIPKDPQWYSCSALYHLAVAKFDRK